MTHYESRKYWQVINDVLTWYIDTIK
jgi:hypothetical protein